MNARSLARRLLPSPHTLCTTRGLRWLGGLLAKRPWLWCANRKRIALGVALGLGVGVIPLPSQMVLAALLAVLFRANVAAAIAATWLTNPLTAAPIWAFAYLLGSSFLSVLLPSHVAGPFVLPSLAPGAWSSPLSAIGQLLEQLGPSLLAGLPLAGLVLGATAYVVVTGAWRLSVVLQMRSRARARAA